MLAFLSLAMTGVVHNEAKDHLVYPRGFHAPEGLEGPVGFPMPVPEAMFSNLNGLELFEIVKELRFGASESWMALCRSHDEAARLTDLGAPWSTNVIHTICAPGS